MPWIYILHLATPLAHARHYSGSTTDLRQRLTDHAIGGGSVFTRRLRELGIEWRLGGLFQLKPDYITMRRAERLLKDQHHAPEYCRICSGARTRRIPGTQEVPLALGGYHIDSVTIRTAKVNGTIPTHKEE